MLTQVCEAINIVLVSSMEATVSRLFATVVHHMIVDRWMTVVWRTFISLDTFHFRFVIVSVAIDTDMSTEWIRPAHIPYPHIWLEFEAKEARDSDRLIKYRIQDLPESRFDEAIQFYCDSYIPDEPMVKTIGW